MDPVKEFESFGGGAQKASDLEEIVRRGRRAGSGEEELVEFVFIPVIVGGLEQFYNKVDDRRRIILWRRGWWMVVGLGGEVAEEGGEVWRGLGSKETKEL